jgi:hypothetical protein
LLNIHVQGDFVALVDRGEMFSTLGGDYVEELAAKLHNAWCRDKKNAGFKWAPVRNNDRKEHPLLKDYSELTEAEKEGNRAPARVALLKLEALGFCALPRQLADRTGVEIVANLDDETRLALASVEHQRWMRDQLRKGYVYAGEINDGLLRHKDICKFASLADPEAHLDTNQIAATIELLDERDMVLARPANDAVTLE